jgi:hypothetical protein
MRAVWVVNGQLLADRRVGWHEAEDVSGHEDSAGLARDADEVPGVVGCERDRLLYQRVLT